MILAKHTVTDVRDLTATVDFRISATEALIASSSTVTAPTLAAWRTWRVRWSKASKDALSSVTLISAASPLVPAEYIVAETQYKQLQCAINASCDDTHADPGDFFNVIQGVETEAGRRIDETDHPLPASDPDQVALLALDASIKAGEAEAAKVRAAVTLPKVAGLIPWYVWGGIGVVAVGVGYSVVRTGQQTVAKAKRDTAYIHENFTSKVLPGYKG